MVYVQTYRSQHRSDDLLPPCVQNLVEHPRRPFQAPKHPHTRHGSCPRYVGQHSQQILLSFGVLPHPIIIFCQS